MSLNIQNQTIVSKNGDGSHIFGDVSEKEMSPFQETSSACNTIIQGYPMNQNRMLV